MKNQVIEDYLKAIFEIQDESNKVSTNALAKRLKLAPASITGMVKKLSEMNLITYERYQGVELSPSGRKVALEVLRHHRLIELFLAEALGLPWDKVHEEAERWEHVISEDVEDRIDALLGHPTRDPHGSPIPDRDGNMVDTPSLTLAELAKGQQAVVVEVRDHNSELLRYLGERNLYPKAEFAIVDVAPFDGPLEVKLGDNVFTLGRKVAEQIFVRLTEEE
ncbi:MAG: metal-dependent transcriptional regulator [Calditrichia bacterium]